jgi:hypothetical protein
MTAALPVVTPGDVSDALSEHRALVVDLDHAATGDELARATAAAEAIQGLLVGRLTGPLTSELAGLVGALTTTLTPHLEAAREVVGVPDLDEALGVVAQSVSAAPLASATLDGLLRVTARLPVAEGLVAESLAYSMLLGGTEFATWRAGTPQRPVPVIDEPAVLLERDGDVLRIALNRPQRHNAFTAQVRDALIEGLQVAVLDPSVTVELRGRGASFCSGGDLDEFGTARQLVEAHLLRVRHSAGRLLHQLSRRTTAYLHGACIGAGIELPAFTHRVVAAPGTYLQLPELRMGLVPGAGGTVSVTRRIGRHRTAYLALTAARLDVETALSWGLVDELGS